MTIARLRGYVAHFSPAARCGALRGVIVTFLVVLSACVNHGRAPIEQKEVKPEPAATVGTRAPAKRVRPEATAIPAHHRVSKGDTLHAIAWRYHLDFRDLVRWNGLRNPDLIVVGQKLRLKAPPPPRKPAKTARAAKKKADPVNSPARAASAAVQWRWPARGKVSVARSVSGSHGIQIHGKRGQEINAAAPGAVVYSGSGLRGYGELIIIKHSETFLSAYAHNEARLVEEGQRVRPGQLIARMGDTDARDVMLHFEIRRDGKTVDPFRYLPKR